MTGAPGQFAASASKPVSPKQGHDKKPIFIVLAVLLCLLIGGGIYIFFKQTEKKHSLFVSGRIEGYETNVGPKIGGRVDFIAAREGEYVKKGQLIVQISDDDVQAQLRGAEARIRKAEEACEESRFKAESIKNQIEESRLRVSQAGEDSLGRIREAQANVARNQAQLSESEALLSQSLADLQLAFVRKQRYEFLVAKLAVTKDEYDQAVTTHETSQAVVKSRRAAVEAAKRQLAAANGQLAMARSSRLSPEIQNAEMLSLKKQLLQAEHGLKQAEHEVANATADRDHVKANIAYLRILSPIDGVITARPVEPGAVVVPGQTLLSIINLDTVYLRGYIPEQDIGNVRVGQKARVYLDAKPDKPMEGQVIQIDPEGSFTPENIYFKSDRVKQVFGIKVAIHQPGGYAKPGMPADAELILEP